MEWHNIFRCSGTFLDVLDFKQALDLRKRPSQSSLLQLIYGEVSYCIFCEIDFRDNRHDIRSSS